MAFQDAHHVRDQLVVALGPASDEYFDLLRSFLSKRITRTQWDTSAQRLLGPLNANLHNEFVRSLFYSSSATLPQDSVSHPSRRAGRASAPFAAAPAALQAQFRSQGAATSTTTPVLGSATLTSSPVPSSSLARTTTATSSSTSGQKKWVSALHDQARPVRTLGALSDKALDTTSLASYRATNSPFLLSHLKAAVYLSASEEGMQDVEQSAIDLIKIASEIFLKTLLEEAMVVSGKYFQQHDECRHHFKGRKNKRSPAISVPHLNLVCQLKPHLLGCLLPTFREACLLAIDDATEPPMKRPDTAIARTTRSSSTLNSTSKLPQRLQPQSQSPLVTTSSTAAPVAVANELATPTSSNADAGVPLEATCALATSNTNVAETAVVPSSSASQSTAQPSSATS
eukprot:m.85703 g.85703  ORF g.85703 m.85703 type:complete len:399 (+) comp12786_c0_seq1:236-1432(+)